MVAKFYLINLKILLFFYFNDFLYWDVGSNSESGNFIWSIFCNCYIIVIMASGGPLRQSSTSWVWASEWSLPFTFYCRRGAIQLWCVCCCCFVDLLIYKMFTFCLGPTLLFERFVKGKKSSKCYYACSATRDRKLCGFYRLVDDKHVGQKSKIDIKEDDRTSFPYSHDECTERWATCQAGNGVFPVVFSFLKTLLWKWAIFMEHDCVKLCNDFWISLLYVVSVID